MDSQNLRRRRGVILTTQGLQKLQSVIAAAEYHDHISYTLEALSSYTGLDPDTLSKVFACETGVDRRTLCRCFKAFNLGLESNDYSQPDASPIAAAQHAQPAPLTTELDLELPEGQVRLSSPFYVERPPIESRCYQSITKLGALLLIKAPQQMGKTSLMSRILEYAVSQGYRAVSVNMQLVDSKMLQNLEQFLRWFCGYVGRSLNLPNQLDAYWDGFFGSKISCMDYFENYLLPHLNHPLVLGLDDIDHLFQYSEVVDDFLSLLRAVHEAAKHRQVWQKLRLILVHSTDVYIPLNIHQSPFNVGQRIELPEFLPEQVHDLAQRHGFDWEAAQVQQLMDMVGGHPYLVRVALYHLAQQETTLGQFLHLAPTEFGAYSSHLRRLLLILQQQPTLANTFKAIVDVSSPVRVEPLSTFKLYSMGLIRVAENVLTPRCELYRQYFRERLSVDIRN
jgi:hypothetical protein